MTAARDELHRLVDELPDEQVDNVVDELRRRTAPRESSGQWPPAFFGSIKSANNGRTDNASRVDELLAEGFGQRRS